MIFAPQNIIQPGPALTLIDLYKITLGKMGYAPTALPPSLFFTFCGDLLGSSGEHYVKGGPVTFNTAVFKASHTFSDDFMESLAMALMRDQQFETDPVSLMQVRDRFYDLLKGHFEAASLTYSPWFRPLFESRTTDDFLKIIAGHASCGAAMRVGVLGATATEIQRMEPLLLCSHAHAEALEGAYLVYGFTRACAEGAGDFATALRVGYEYAGQGWSLAENFLRRHGLTPEGQRIQPLYEKVRLHEDPYATIEDIAEEGIETRFVVPAALWLVEQAAALPPPAGIAKIVEGALEIGGDPDTISSIAMGLYGQLAGAPAYAALAAVQLPNPVRDDL